ncbi:MAG: Slp family lipoprotein [Thermodesulfovibrionales bacterium]|nr:Slp family lipoprotein [Thermodesulfovibrionales bacterium]
MKKFFLIIFVVITVLSCAPVLRQEIMETGIRDFSLSDTRNNPDLYRGKPFILGGLIVNTKFIERGSLIEAVYVPVDSRGYLKDMELSNGRFLAIFPKEKGLLDPLIYRRGREITLAGEFIEVRSGRIDEMEYTYPVFEIKEIYLWKERKVYYPDYRPYWCDYPYPYHYWWDPWWWRHYPPYWW